MQLSEGVCSSKFRAPPDLALSLPDYPLVACTIASAQQLFRSAAPQAHPQFWNLARRRSAALCTAKYSAAVSYELRQALNLAAVAIEELPSADATVDFRTPQKNRFEFEPWITAYNCSCCRSCRDISLLLKDAGPGPISSAPL